MSLWDFSLRFYAQPGVAKACLELQDRCGVDVNLLLFLCWRAQETHTLNTTQIDAIDREIGVWRRDVVQPLRQARRNLKTTALPDIATESLRQSVKSAELEAERLQQLRLQNLASEYPGHPAETPDAALRGSIGAYAAFLGQHFTAEPIIMIQNAFQHG